VISEPDPVHEVGPEILDAQDAREGTNFEIFAVDLGFLDLAPLDLGVDNLSWPLRRWRWRLIATEPEEVSEKERETDFPFLYFLVVVPARENHVALVLSPEQEAPRYVNPDSCACMPDLVCPVLTLDDRRLGLGVNHTGTEGEER
jgi:hypothetical protein